MTSLCSAPVCLLLWRMAPMLLRAAGGGARRPAGRATSAESWSDALGCDLRPVIPLPTHTHTHILILPVILHNAVSGAGAWIYCVLRELRMGDHKGHY